MDDQSVSGDKITWLEAWNNLIAEHPDAEEHEAVSLFMDFWKLHNIEVRKDHENLWQSIVENIAITIRHIAIAIEILQDSKND